MPKKPKSIHANPTGRPRLEIDTKILKALAAIGASQEEIVSGLIGAGCKLDIRTLKRRLQEDAYRAIYDDGINQFRLGIRRQQKKQSLMMNSAGVSMNIHLSKHFLGQTEKAALELTGKNGGPISTVDLTKATDEQIAALEALFGPLAGAGGDDEGNQGRESAPAA